MRIGLQLGGDLDQIVEKCHVAEVDEIVLSTRAIPAFAETGTVTVEDVVAFKAALAEQGIKVYAMTPPNPSREAVMGHNEAEVDTLCDIIRAIGGAGVRNALFYPVDRFLNYLKEYHHTKPPLEIMPGEEGWDKIIAFFRRVSEVAESVDLHLGCHIFSVPILRAILEAVPSTHLGVTYCTGTYQFGEDPYMGVALWGLDHIFLAHARNLVRHGPGRQGHEEVPLPEGDVDMGRFVRILVEAGYDGLMIPEHLGDAGELAGSVAYLRGLVAQAGG